jgi:DNA-binding transcriptional MerR regulator
MKQLSAATGVPKGTIQFYIKEGLIPRPIKTHTNMAYYTEAHINGIRMVKELQSKRYLPLSVIKQILKYESDALSADEIRTIVDLDGKLFQSLRENLPKKKVTAQQLSERTGVSLKEMRDLERIRILHPVRKGKKKFYDEDDIRFLECWKRMRELGFTEELGFDASVIVVHRELLERLVEEEARILTSRASGKVEAEKLIKMVEEGTTVLNTMIGIIHKRLMLETTKKYALELKEEE